MSWQIEAEYLENCNCEILCPCVTSPVMKGSYDRCLVPLVVRIARGQKDGVSLDGLGFVWLVDAPGTMSEGGWRVGIYLDEQATPEQAAALEEIVTGRAGGVPGIIGSLTGELVGIKHVPFEFTPGGNVWSVRVPGLLDVEVEGIILPGQTEPTTITNVAHPMSSSLPIAKGLKGVVSDADFGFEWDNAGKNGHFARFQWEG